MRKPAQAETLPVQAAPDGRIRVWSRFFFAAFSLQDKEGAEVVERAPNGDLILEADEVRTVIYGMAKLCGRIARDRGVDDELAEYIHDLGECLINKAAELSKTSEQDPVIGLFNEMILLEMANNHINQQPQDEQAADSLARLERAVG